MLMDNSDEKPLLIEAPSGARLGFSRPRRVAAAVMLGATILLLFLEIGGMTAIHKASTYNIYSNGLGLALCFIAFCAAIITTLANEEPQGCFLITMLVTQVLTITLSFLTLFYIRGDIAEARYARIRINYGHYRPWARRSTPTPLPQDVTDARNFFIIKGVICAVLMMLIYLCSTFLGIISMRMVCCPADKIRVRGENHAEEV